MKKIDTEEIRRIQLDILNSIDVFCRKNNIKYSLAYGTLLGAIRHKGFIPWDDDIDIAMTRSNYERFITEFYDESNTYKIYNSRTDNDVNIFFTKISDTRTIVIEDGNSKNLGISVDLFPIDYLEDTYEDSIKHLYTYKKIVRLMTIKNRGVHAVKSFHKKIIISLLKVFLFFINKHKPALIFDSMVKKHKNRKAKYSCMIIDIDKNQIQESNIWENYINIKFEGKEYMAIEDFDTYLKCAYGDYMKIPPIEKRIPKHDFRGIYWIE